MPSAGPDFGKLIDQAAVLREFDFPTVMVMPQRGASHPDGIARGVRLFAERLGCAVLLYIKDDDYLPPATVRKLVDDGVVQWVKYAVIREHWDRDDYLREIVAQIDPARVISGIGERPAIDHLKTYGLGSFTTGSGTIAPRASMALLHAIKAQDWTEALAIRSRFMAVEDLRDAHGPIPVLHDAVSLSGIADMGPILPLLANIAPALRAPLTQAVSALLEQEQIAVLS